MATDLDRAKSPAASKYDAFVASQLAQAEKRIRLLDLTAGLLGFAALSLAYIVGMVFCDSKLMLAPQTRQLSLYFFLAGGAVYLFFTILRPLWLRVNPYYAARQVERQLPGAKNSIVNWIDLHEQPLPPAIRGALGQRAAKDLSHVDLEGAISGRRAAWMGGFAGLFAVVFIASFFLLGPAPFLSLLKRTFNPFREAGISTRTQLTLLRPENGNATVTVGRGINFVVAVNGKVPDPKAKDAVKLLYRYEEGDPWLERLLLQEPSREWTTSLSAIEVKNGFWFKITGSDTATEEYHVGVRAAPALIDFLATYHFRPYVARADEVRHEREVKELRGTEILLRVRTNRMLREGRMEFEGKDGTKNVRGEVDANDPHTLLLRFVLEEDGKYRLHFTSAESEAYSDSVSYPVTAIPDKPPVVELTKPGEDIRLPADALLHLEGKAGDDIGVKSLMLRLRVVGGDKLRGQPYRSDDRLRLADGGYPRELEYKDFVELSRVKTEDGQALPLRAGMELEYWLEASDACDYPQANVAESKHYRVLLIEPEKNEPKRQQEKKQSEKDKKQHEQKQDQKLRKENQERQQQRQEQEARNKEEENKNKDGGKSAAGGQSKEKEGEKANNSENKDNNGGQGENNKDQGEKDELSKEDQKTEEQIKKALEQKEAGKDGKGEAKPDQGDRNEGKEGQQEKPDGGQSGGESKGTGQPDTKESGNGKDKGQPQAGRDPSQGDGKSDKQPSPMPGDKSEPKGNDPMNKAGAGKGGEDKGKPDAAPPGNKGAGQDRDSAKGESKPAEGKGQQSQREAAADAKDKGASRGESKREDDRKDDGKGKAKQGNSPAKDKPSAEDGAKPSSGKKENDPTAKNEGKPDADTPARNATAKEIQDLAKELQSKDAGQREEAKRRLQRIEKEAADPDAREKAGEALKKMGEPDGPADSGSPKSDNGSSGKPNGERKDAREGGQGKDSGQEKGPSGEGKQASSSGGKPRESKGAEGGNTPGGAGRRRGDDGSSGGAAADKGKPAKPRDHRAAQMQLEDFAKKVNKDILKNAGVSEEAWKKYLQSKRNQLSAREKSRAEVPSAPQQANQLPSMGGQTIRPAASGQGDAQAPDRGQPPPEYRDSFREFTRQMTKKK